MATADRLQHTGWRWSPWRWRDRWRDLPTFRRGEPRSLLPTSIQLNLRWWRAPSPPAAAVRRRSRLTSLRRQARRARSSKLLRNSSAHHAGQCRRHRHARWHGRDTSARRLEQRHQGQSHRRVCDVQICRAGATARRRRQHHQHRLPARPSGGAVGARPTAPPRRRYIHFTRILAMDHAIDKIRANTISPGFILTERSSRRSGGKAQARPWQGRAICSTARASPTKSPPVRPILPPTTQHSSPHRSFDRWRLCRLQRPDRRRRPTPL